MQQQASYFAAVAVMMGLPVAASALETPPIVVTAERLPTSVDETLAPVTVITRADIEATNPQSIDDLLRLQPGVDVARSGGLGGNTSVFLRGTNSNHVLVLIDGVRASSPASGLFAWRQMSPAQIERIEIVRGPRATLYGSDAVGGVIQIFTRQPEGVTASVTAGSQDTQRAEAGFGFGAATRLTLNTSFVRTDGISATNPGNPSYDPDDDGFINRSLNARFTAPLWGNAALRLSGWYANGDVEFDQGVQGIVNGNFSARLTDSPARVWGYALTLGFNQDDIETKSAFPSKISTQRTTLDWQNNLHLSKTQSLTLGLTWRRNIGKNSDPATSVVVFNDFTTNTGVYANWLGAFGNSDLEAGVRYNHQSEFGGYVTGQFAWGYSLGAGYRVILSYGTAFKAPDLNELFHPGFGGFFAGNPDLEPERSRSAELAVRYHQPGGRRRLEANLFYTRIDDLIAFEGEMSQAINIDEAKIPGLELQYTDGIGRWSLHSSLTLQRPRNISTHARLLRRPDSKFSLVLARALGNGGLIRGELLRVGQRADVGDETLGGYTLFNLSGQIRLAQAWSVEGRIENVTDKQYENAFGFNTLGRVFYLSLRYAADD
ncbi:TonB-dependent receptor domain-containing protein [Nitrococcus mobilis]|uniref:Probable tonB-dependent receptor n=1 Tax=Nitrococcus mobilis Nb-231 TaxID=314278 RepID=A4BNQ2_9GAMM|nr:TonB-dependent receptor [Nitrococcus mobilis]EAR22851.1 probable tonB-dependent receptor [Nitrococcus mobilis Nb-231]